MWSRPPSPYGLEPFGHYSEALSYSVFWHFPWSWARKSQECIDSTTGAVLAPKVQPETHQVIGTVNGTDGLPFLPPSAESDTHTHTHTH